MKDRRILIVWEHGGNLGHLSRLLPIALELRQTGFEVVFAVADVAAASKYFDPLKFSFVSMPRVVLQTAHDPGAVNHADLMLKAGFGEPVQAAMCIQQWHRLIQLLKPSAVLVDGSPIALYASRSASLPTLVIGHGFEIPPPLDVRPCFTPWIENANEKSIKLEAHLQNCFDNLLRRLAVDVRGAAPQSMDELFSLSQVMLCAWPEFDHFDRPSRQTESPTRYTGPIWSEPPTAKVQVWPEGDGPKILCYLNLRDKRFDLIWQALLKQSANVLVISPNGVARACEAARGWGITVIEEPISLGRLVNDCDAVVGHGGMGLTSMALSAGKPTLLLPEHMEQAILAYRLSRQELAIATIRWKDKDLAQKKVNDLVTGDVLKLSSQKFSAQYSNYKPADAAYTVAVELAHLV